MSYQDKLKDPRWQKMRLEIMERDGFKCRKCQAEDKTLHVHHSFYMKHAEPWEYPPYSLVTLCERCHEQTEGAVDRARSDVGSLFVSDCFCEETAGRIMNIIASYNAMTSRAGETFITAEDFLMRCAAWSFYQRGLEVGKQTSTK